MCGDRTLDYEVACIDLSPLDEGEEEPGKTSVASLGLWTDISVRLVKLPSLEEITKEYLGGEIIPRSILITKFEGTNYLLCALGDGSLFYFVVSSAGTLTDRKKVTLGTQPTVLRKFRTGAVSHVFACSDRPMVIYSSNQKLVFSTANLREVRHMCPLNTEVYRDSLALATDTTLTIGTIHDIEKMDVRSIHLGESPRRVTYQEETASFGVLSVRTDIHSLAGLQPSRPSASTQAFSISSSSRSSSTFSLTLGQEVGVYSFLIVEQHSFQVVHSHQLRQQEVASCLLSCKLGDDPTPYYVVGTCFEDAESTMRGRLIIFSWADGKLTQVAEKEVTDAPYSLISFRGKLLASFNNTVRLWQWTQEKELRLECSHHDNKLNFAMYLRARGDLILLCDLGGCNLRKNLTLLRYKTMEGNLEGSLEVIARDSGSKWMTGVEIIDEDT